MQNTVLEDNTHLATTAILPFGMTDNGIDNALYGLNQLISKSITPTGSVSRLLYSIPLGAWN